MNHCTEDLYPGRGFGYPAPGRLKFLVREVLQAIIEAPLEEREVSRDLST